MNYVEMAITDRYVQCGYPMRKNSMTMSDCCMGHATSMVEGPGGWYYRCDKHEGWYDATHQGAVRYTMQVRYENGELL